LKTEHSGRLFKNLNGGSLILAYSYLSNAYMYLNQITPCFVTKLDPLLFHHIFALTAMNCIKIFRSRGLHRRCCLLWI